MENQAHVAQSHSLRVSVVAEEVLVPTARYQLVTCGTSKEVAMAIDKRRHRVCFVTIGATARFDSLIISILTSSFLQALQARAYTHLSIQYGKEGAKIYEDFVDANPAGSKGQYGLEIDGFDFKREGLQEDFKSVKGDKTIRSTGVVLSHAGVH